MNRPSTDSSGPADPPRPTVAAIILAGGGSSRMSHGHKLLEDVWGRPVVAWAVDAALAAGLGPVVVVTGHRADEVEAALPPGAVAVRNPGWASGMAGSLRTGVGALPDGTDAFAIGLADMPAVRAAHYRLLAEAWAPGAVVVPTHATRRGHPVIWSGEFAAEMAELDGDSGARRLLARHNDVVIEVPIEDRGVLVDVDTREQLAAARALLTPLDGGP